MKMAVDIELGWGARRARALDAALQLLIRSGTSVLRSLSTCPACWLLSTLLLSLAGIGFTGYDVPLVVEVG